MLLAGDVGHLFLLWATLLATSWVVFAGDTVHATPTRKVNASIDEEQKKTHEYLVEFDNGRPVSITPLFDENSEAPEPHKEPHKEPHEEPHKEPPKESEHKHDNKTTHRAPASVDSILGYEESCGVRNIGSSDRIVGGVDAEQGEFPWQISLQKKRIWDMQHICGGAIVSPYWVVTAGHCVEGVDVKTLSVVAGDHDLYKVEGTEQRRKVVRLVGLGYDKNTFANDITLLQLDRKLHFNAKHVAPICVPKPGHHYSGEAVVSGWGRLSETGGLPNVLQQVALPLIPWHTCKKMYKSRGFLRFLHTCQICSGRTGGGQDSCQGDSGGPLACREGDGRYYLCGVVSWGIGCARANFPGVYTETSCYARWINEVLYNEHHYLDPEKNTEDEEKAKSGDKRDSKVADKTGS